MKSKEKPKKSSSEEGDDDPEGFSVEENSTSQNSPKTSPHNRKTKIFSSNGYETHLIDSLEKDILQRDPSIQWNDVAGLNDAKAILQEAVVLPVIMPEFFKGIRRPWKVKILNIFFLFHECNHSVLVSFRIGHFNGWTTRDRQNNAGKSSGHRMWYHIFQRLFQYAHIEIPWRK